MRVLMEEVAPGLRNQPLGSHQESDAAAIASTEPRQMRRQLGEIAIGQVGDHPSESFERCQPADIAGPDVVNERVRIAMQIE